MPVRRRVHPVQIRQIRVTQFFDVVLVEAVHVHEEPAGALQHFREICQVPVDGVVGNAASGQPHISCLAGIHRRRCDVDRHGADLICLLCQSLQIIEGLLRAGFPVDEVVCAS